MLCEPSNPLPESEGRIRWVQEQPLPEVDEKPAATDVLIVGAGPTGLALACDLARRGVNFRIVDKIATYFAGSRGKGLQPRSLEVLDDLGIVEEIVANGRF